MPMFIFVCQSKEICFQRRFWGSILFSLHFLFLEKEDKKKNECMEEIEGEKFRAEGKLELPLEERHPV